MVPKILLLSDLSAMHLCLQAETLNQTQVDFCHISFNLHARDACTDDDWSLEVVAICQASLHSAEGLFPIHQDNLLRPHSWSSSNKD